MTELEASLIQLFTFNEAQKLLFRRFLEAYQASLEAKDGGALIVMDYRALAQALSEGPSAEKLVRALEGVAIWAVGESRREVLVAYPDGSFQVRVERDPWRYAYLVADPRLVVVYGGTERSEALPKWYMKASEDYGLIRWRERWREGKV